MLTVRAILVPVLLAVLASPLTPCAVELTVNGDNCHGRVAPEAAADPEAGASHADAIAFPVDDRPHEEPRHDSTCRCDEDRPTSRSEPIDLPAFLNLPLPLPPLALPRSDVRPALTGAVLPSPALAAVSLPLLN